MYKLGILLILLCACGDGDRGASSDGIPARFTVAGHLDNGDLSEASGLAASWRREDMLWTHEDSGHRARIYAFDLTGRSVGRIRLERADNRDWEDMASFSLDGVPYLLIADTGDNDAQHDESKLYVVEEPDLLDDDRPELEAAWEIAFSYPDGPRDAEAVAVDAANERVLVLTKNDIPPALYAVPLRPANDAAVIATYLDAVATLPRPSRRDVEFAPGTGDLYWQPTAMDIARDGSAVVIMTYGAVYYYRRNAQEDIVDSLRRPPLAFPLHDIQDAEAIAFNAGGDAIFITTEKKRAPLFRIDIGGEQQ